MPSETIRAERDGGQTAIWVLAGICVVCLIALANFEGYYLYLLRISPTHLAPSSGQTAWIGGHGVVRHYIQPTQLKLLSGGAVGSWLIMAYCWMLLMVCFDPKQVRAFFRRRSHQTVIYLLPVIVAGASLYYWTRVAGFS